MNNLTLEEQLESRDFCSPTSGVLNKTCDPCRSRKIKCDGGFPECSECEARKKKNRGKHFQCSYSFRKRAERRRKSDESSPQNIQVEEAQALSELTNLRHPNINTSHLKCCVETLQHLLPILNNEEISLAGFEELKHEQVERCGVGFWACLAIGAFLEGDVPQAKQMYDNACSLLLLVDNSISPASFISSQLLICLFLKMTGEGRSAGHFLKSAEKASENCSEYQAIVAAFKLAFMSVETYAEVAFSFEIDDMPNFTFDSKIYFYYRSLLQQHTLSGFFNQFSQARECYQMFLLAEEHTHASGLILKSPNNWVRLQPFLILLELCHIGMPMEALKRARRLTLFLLQNQEYIQKIRKVVDISPLLSIVSPFFQEIQDVTFLEMVMQIRASVSPELSSHDQFVERTSESPFFVHLRQLIKHVAGKIEEDSLDMKQMMTEPIEDVLGV